MRGHRAAVAILVIAAALVVAGCGGDDEETTTGASGATGVAGPLTPTEYRAQADRICRAGDRELQRLASERGLGPDSSTTELQAFATEHTVPNFEAQLERLRALPAPESDEEELAAVYDRLEEGIAQLEETPESLTEGPPPALEEASELAAEYGFDDCGS